MARRFLKDGDGLTFCAPMSMRRDVFMLAQTILAELGVEAVAATVRNPLNGEEGMAIYLVGEGAELTERVLRRACELWMEFLGGTGTIPCTRSVDS